jgi:hypothetical protein
MPNGTAGSNVFGVQADTLDYTDQYSPTTQSMHGGLIKVAGRIVGRLNSWNVNIYSRAGSHIREINKNTYGNPVDYVPQGNEGYTLSSSRAEVWSEEVEIAVGFKDYFPTLTRQRRPFVADELLYKGDSLYRWNRYLGCWFTSKNFDQWSSEGAAEIRTSPEIAFVAKQHLA